jgi:hypothetical protein
MAYRGVHPDDPALGQEDPSRSFPGVVPVSIEAAYIARLEARNALLWARLHELYGTLPTDPPDAA